MQLDLGKNDFTTTEKHIIYMLEGIWTEKYNQVILESVPAQKTSLPDHVKGYEHKYIYIIMLIASKIAIAKKWFRKRIKDTIKDWIKVLEALKCTSSVIGLSGFWACMQKHLHIRTMVLLYQYQDFSICCFCMHVFSVIIYFDDLTQ